MNLVPALAVASLLLFTACSSDEASGSTSGTGGSTTTGAGGAGGSISTGGSTSTGGGGSGGAGGAGCSDAPLEAAAEDAGPFLGGFIYLAQSTLGEPVDVLSFEFIGDGEAPAVGMRTITGADYATCTDCVLLSLGCDGNLANCASTYLADAGTIDITTSGMSGETFAGALQNLHLVEVTIDGNTSTPVPNGQELCWPSYAFSAIIQ